MIMQALEGIGLSFAGGAGELARAYTGTYDLRLVATSVLIGIFASFCAFEAAGKVVHGAQRRLRLALGIALLGIGLWAMHFIGMAALVLDTGVYYEVWHTALSLLPAVAGAAIAMQILSDDGAGMRKAAVAGAAVGVCMLLMHQAGIAAIRFTGTPVYDLRPFLLSIAAALAIAPMAMLQAQLVRRSGLTRIPYLASLVAGTLLGLSLAAVRYIAMEAAYFVPRDDIPAGTAINPAPLALAVAIAVVLLLFFGLLLVFFGNRIATARHDTAAILATTSQGFVMQDAEGRITQVNAAMERMLGMPEAQLVGMRFFDLLAEPADAAGMWGDYDIETCLRRADGNLLPCSVYGNIVRDRFGRPRYSFALLGDISARVAAEGRMREQARELEVRADELYALAEERRAIFDAATIGIALVEDGVIRRCNRRAGELFGQTVEELTGKHVQVWFPGRADYASAAPLFRAADPQRIEKREQQLVRRDDSLFWARLTARALDPAGPARGTLVLVEDMTAEHETAEAMRLAKEAAEDANRVKSEFLANMSHELRTPMNAVIGTAYLMTQTGLSARQQDYADRIDAAGRNLLAIINDILDFSRIDAGKLEIDRQDFALSTVLDGLAGLIGQEATAKGLELVFDVAAAVPEHLVGDPIRLGQILQNFGSNAVKFTESGEIVLTISVLEEGPDDVLLHIAMRDTGIGLDARAQAKLFNAFQQADASSTRRHGGTGLGLAIVKRLAEAMGGRVGVDSEAGQGSTFWATARLARGAHATPWQPAPAGIAGCRALVADDNAASRASLARALATLGFAVETADAGAAAVEAVRRAGADGHPFDLVLLDWDMPGMNGAAAARHIRQLGLTATPRLALMTGYGRESVAEAAHKAGFDGVFVKPAAIATLYRNALGALGRQPDQDATVVAQTRATPPRDALAGLRILLAEDNEINQLVAAELLQAAGIAVEIASDGLEAVDKVSKGHYDAVLMDMHMPNMDGLDAARAIRATHAPDTLPIIAMTANAALAAREQCLAAGMNDHIAKPIDPAQLWRTLAQWTPGRSGAAPVPANALPTPVTTGALPAAIEGLDVSLGLRRVMGRHDLYLSILDKFVAGQGGAGDAIAGALDAGDPATAERLAHTLKGVAGNIGATALQADAAALEAAIRSRLPAQQTAPLLGALSARLADVVAAIRHALPARPMPAAAQFDAPADSAHALEICETLAGLLAEDDSEAVDTFNRHAPLLRAAMPEAFAGIERAVHGFEFREALAALRDGMSHLSAKS